MPNPLNDENIIHKVVPSIMKASMTHNEVEKIYCDWYLASWMLWRVNQQQHSLNITEHVQLHSKIYPSLLQILLNTALNKEMITLMDQFLKDAFKKKVEVDKNAVKCLKSILNTLCSETNINWNHETVQCAMVLSYMAVVSKLWKETTPTVYEYTLLINRYVFVENNDSSKSI